VGADRSGVIRAYRGAHAPEKAVRSNRVRSVARTHIFGGRTAWVMGLVLSGLLVFIGSRLRSSISDRADTLPRAPAEVLSPASPKVPAAVRALVEEVLRALRASDRAALERLVLSREEFCAALWPHVPPTPNLTCEWVWAAYAPQNSEGLRRILREHGGRDYTLLRIEPRRIVSSGPVRVYEEVRIIVMDEAGRQRPLRLFGSICDLGRIVRLCSFIVD